MPTKQSSTNQVHEPDFYAEQSANEQSASANEQNAKHFLSSSLALWLGIAFSAAFTGIIWIAGEHLRSMVTLLPDEGVSWYYWKLPVPTLWTRFVVWGMYFAHQIALWYLIYYAQSRPHTYTRGLHKVNIWALAVNVGFIVLHFIQTHTTYDGLAQDVSIFSSQGSVIVLLVWVLQMENNRRGLFFGKGVGIAPNIMQAARTYHGYFFAWAVVYTFWYHPMENTNGHLIGFFYTFLLLLQSSLFFTRIHTNKWWTFAQEFIVLVHGTLVALMQAGTDGFWPMFFFGFGGIFIITQMHGLGLSVLSRWGFTLAYLAGVIVVYARRGWGHLNEVVRIPVIDYVAVFALVGIMWVCLRVSAVVRRGRG